MKIFCRLSYSINADRQKGRRGLKIVHLSDTHIGYSAYSKVDEKSGLNQREVDVFNAFKEVVDRILEINPDAVLHSGDLFDSVRPTNRAISFAIEQLVRITDKGIPVVVIAGNHSTPRLQETGSVFRIFEHISGIKPVYKGSYEKIRIGDMAVHAISHCDSETLRENIEMIKIAKDAQYNIMMLHAGVVGLSVFKMDEFNEALIQSSYLRKEFDYIALGHYHGYFEINDNACYAGSTERFSFAEADQKKGFLVVDLKNKRKEFVEIKTREMIDLPIIDASMLNAISLKEEIERVIELQPLDGKIVRLRIKNLRSSLYKTIDFGMIREMTKSALVFDLRYDLIQENMAVQPSTTMLSSLPREFISFLERHPVEGVNKEVIRDLGLEYLNRGLEESD
jgi:DNA repair exonuclease SbcCD nuclease subunit